MIEVWFRPGKENIIQERFEESINEIKEARWSASLDESRRRGRDAKEEEEVFLHLGKDLELAESLSQVVSNYRDSIRIGEPVEQTADEAAEEAKTAKSLQPHIERPNPKKRKNQPKAKVAADASDKCKTPEVKESKVYKLYRVGDKWKDGSYKLQELNGWADKKISDIGEGSPEKAAALSAMISYLRGDISETVDNGRAVTRHSAKKLTDNTVAINGKKYPRWTLKPDAVPSVTIKGKELAHVRVTYVTIGDNRVILGIFSDRNSYDRATK